MSAFDTTLGYSRQTEDGAQVVYYINKTGAASVKGTVVETSSSVSKAVEISAADCIDPIGVILESGIPDGELVPVVISGPAQVLLEDDPASTSGTLNYWVRTSASQAGRADATNAAPAGGTIGALEDHLQEMGHCLETVAGGTDVLCWVHLHFN